MEPTSESHNERKQAINRLVKEYYQACEQGRPPYTAEFIANHRDFADELREFFLVWDSSKLRHRRQTPIFGWPRLTTDPTVK